MGHNKDSRQAKQHGDGFSCEESKQGDFIMSATAPFTSSIIPINARASFRAEVVQDTRELAGASARRPRSEEARLNTSAVVCNTAAAEDIAAERNRRKGSGAVVMMASPTAALPLRPSSGRLVSAARPRRLAPLPQGLQSGELTDKAALQTAMSPVSAAGRLAYVADVTARVHRMRARGRRTPDAAVAPAQSCTTSSEHGSPRSINLPSFPSVSAFPFPKLQSIMPKPKR